MKKTILIITLLTLFIITGCAQEQRNQDELLIMTSSFPLYEFAREIAGEIDQVEMLIPPGTDVHHYDLKPSDLVKIEQADLIIFIGEDMEPWIKTILDLDGKHKDKTIQATQKVQLIKTKNEHDDEYENDEKSEEEHDDEDDDHDAEYDPHIWLDFENSIEIVNAITSKLSTLKPENQETYRKNADEYIQQLRDLNRNYEETLRNCETRAFITNHDSFRYLANKYELKQIPIRGLSAEQEPNPRTITNIINEAKEHDIRVVFFEELASPRVSEAIAKELNAKTMILSPGGNIPAKDWEQKTFINLMQENLENLKIGLRCE